MLEVEQDGEKDTTHELVPLYTYVSRSRHRPLMLCAHISSTQNGCQQDAIHKAIVLEVDMVNNDEARMQEE